VEGELAVRCSLEESISQLFFPSARDALAALLREHEMDEQAELLMRGELVELDVHWCDIGDDGAEIVADFLKHDETVKEVNLVWCEIGTRGVKVIAESLKHNHTVVEMYLSNNQIGDEGTEALIEALSYNACMISLYFPVNNIAPELQATIEYITETRNKILIPAAVRQASLYLIAARRNIADAGLLAIFPKEIVRMIAMKVWTTRNQPIWLNALTESERTGESGDE
jgi:hypothetical protein